MLNKNYTKYNYPLVNITMPVWNRMDETICSILSVKKYTKTPYFLTVVDNGSKNELKKELLNMYDNGIIDNLYFLNSNYGVSCACNTGWKLNEASFYMKLDNDMEIISETWMNDIFIMWGKSRYNTLFGPVWHCEEENCKTVSDYGIYWTIPVSLSGAAFLASAKIIKQIGYFSEDYGVYGEEDADYCLRCHYAGIRKYTFESEHMIIHRGNDDKEYISRNINKRNMHRKNVGDGNKKGLFALNIYLYQHALRPLDVPLKYEISAVREHDVELKENPRHSFLYKVLLECLEVFNSPVMDEVVKRERIRHLLACVDY